MVHMLILIKLFSGGTRISDSLTAVDTHYGCLLMGIEFLRYIISSAEVRKRLLFIK